MSIAHKVCTHAFGSCKDIVAHSAHILKPAVVQSWLTIGGTKPSTLAEFGFN